MFGKIDYAMVNVSDMGRSVAFYHDTLGFAMRFESPGWSEFETGAITLALHHTPASADPSSARDSCAGTCTLGLSVADLDATYAELSKRGAHFVMPPMDQPGEGIRLAVCVDPDGLAISFAQALPRDGA